jgi:hypothetical protein
MTMKKTTEEILADIPKNVGVEVESHIALGTTPEFAWYEVEVLLKDMQQTRVWEARIKRLVDVMTAHRAQQDKMIVQLMDENRGLKVKLQSYVNHASS